MSKSLGNVVDPLNVIDDQGCDALRFTLATGTAAGQDLNLNMDRLASNRNFTNKIWNAGKFLLYSLEGMSDDERVALVDEAEAVPTNLTNLPSPRRGSSRVCTPPSTTSPPRTTATISERRAERRTPSSTTTSPTGSSRVPNRACTATTPTPRVSPRPPRCTSLSAPSECFIRSCPTSPKRCGDRLPTAVTR